MSDELLYEQDGHVVTLTMNRPEQMNALSYQETFEAFVSAADRIQNDLSVRCVILTGKGRAFSAGGNVKQMRERAGIFGSGGMKTRDSYRNGWRCRPSPPSMVRQWARAVTWPACATSGWWRRRRSSPSPF